MVKETFNKRFFDCRRYLRQGDLIEYDCGDIKNDFIFKGAARVKKVYEQFVYLSGYRTDIGVNCWDIKAVNGKPIQGGCFGKWMEKIV